MKGWAKWNELLEVLRVHGASIGLKINVKKIKSLRLELVKMNRRRLDDKKIDRMNSFTYLGNI